MSSITYNCSKLLKESFKINHRNILRYSHLQLNNSNVDFDILSYIRTDEEYKIGKVAACKKFSEIFNVTRRLSMNVVIQHEILLKVTGKLMSENYVTCRKYGITNMMIFLYPYVLGQKQLLSKIFLVKKLCPNINNVIPLLKLDVHILENLEEKAGSNIKGRIHTLSKLLKISTNYVCDQMIKKDTLLQPNLMVMKELTKLCLQYGYTSSEIFNNWSVFQLSYSDVATKLKYAKKQNIKVPIKKLHVDFQTFANNIEVECENRRILGEKPLHVYLAEKIPCTRESALLMMLNEPLLETQSVKMIDNVIDFLYKEGFKPDHILASPKILLYDISKIQEKFAESKKLGLPIYPTVPIYHCNNSTPKMTIKLKL